MFAVIVTVFLGIFIGISKGFGIDISIDIDISIGTDICTGIGMLYAPTYEIPTYILVLYIGTYKYNVRVLYIGNLPICTYVPML